MLFMNIINIIILILSPLSKAEIQFKNFCSKVKKQMEEIYNNFNISEENNNIIENINNDQNKKVREETKKTKKENKNK